MILIIEVTAEDVARIIESAGEREDFCPVGSALHRATGVHWLMGDDMAWNRTLGRIVLPAAAAEWMAAWEEWFAGASLQEPELLRFEVELPERVAA